MNESQKKQVIELIAKGKLSKAIDFSQKIIETIDIKYKSSIILLSSRYSSLVSQNNLGTISQENFQIELNKLSVSLLSEIESFQLPRGKQSLSEFRLRNDIKKLTPTYCLGKKLQNYSNSLGMMKLFKIQRWRMGNVMLLQNLGNEVKQT